MPPIYRPPPSPEKVPPKSFHERHAILHESNALDHWREAMAERRRYQEQLAEQLGSSPSKLTMNHGDGYRAAQEQRYSWASVCVCDCTVWACTLSVCIRYTYIHTYVCTYVYMCMYVLYANLLNLVFFYFIILFYIFAVYLPTYVRLCVHTGL